MKPLTTANALLNTAYNAIDDDDFEEQLETANDAIDDARSYADDAAKLPPSTPPLRTSEPQSILLLMLMMVMPVT